MDTQTTTTSTGISLGMAMAAAISWSVHHSVLWAFLHGIIGWLYIIGYLLGWADQYHPPTD